MIRTKPITIEPGSGTKLAGKKIRREDWAPGHFSEIIYVGEQAILVKDFYSSGSCYEGSWSITDYWLEVLQDEPKKKWAQALIKSNHSRRGICHKIFTLQKKKLRNISHVYLK